jgi:hypothetical protein
LGVLLSAIDCANAQEIDSVGRWMYRSSTIEDSIEIEVVTACQTHSWMSCSTHERRWRREVMFGGGDRNRTDE